MSCHRNCTLSDQQKGRLSLSSPVDLQGHWSLLPLLFLVLALILWDWAILHLLHWQVGSWLLAPPGKPVVHSSHTYLSISCTSYLKKKTKLFLTQTNYFFNAVSLEVSLTSLCIDILFLMSWLSLFLWRGLIQIVSNWTQLSLSRKLLLMNLVALY